jgi:hypothetical protein
MGGLTSAISDLTSAGNPQNLLLVANGVAQAASATGEALQVFGATRKFGMRVSNFGDDAQKVVNAGNAIAGVVTGKPVNGKPASPPANEVPAYSSPSLPLKPPSKPKPPETQPERRPIPIGVDPGFMSPRQEPLLLTPVSLTNLLEPSQNADRQERVQNMMLAASVHAEQPGAFNRRIRD